MISCLHCYKRPDGNIKSMILFDVINVILKKILCNGPSIPIFSLETNEKRKKNHLNMIRKEVCEVISDAEPVTISVYNEFNSNIAKKKN